MKQQCVPFVICNPAAGRGRALRRWRLLKRELERRRLPYREAFTRGRLHAASLAERAVAEGCRLIAVVGGDGTLNETVQGLVRDDRVVAHDLKLAFLAGGGSCDFDKSLPAAGNRLQRLLGGVPRKIDLIRVDCHAEDGGARVRYALNGANIGLVARACQSIHTATGLVGLALRFGVDATAVAAGLNAIWNHEPVACRLVTEEQAWQAGRISSFSVLKNSWLMGGMRFGVPAAPDDGLLTVLAVQESSRRQALGLLFRLYRGALDRHPAVEWKRCVSVSFDTAVPEPIEADGELVGRTPARFTVIPAVLPVIV